MKVMKKPAAMKHTASTRCAPSVAPAWASGGSSAWPRRGKLFAGKRSDLQQSGVRGAQQCGKRGASLLAQRTVAKRPARKDYVPTHQKQSNIKIDMRTAAAKAPVKAFHVLQWSAATAVSKMRAGGQLQNTQDCFHCGVANGMGGQFKLRDGSDMVQRRCGACRRWNLPHAGHPIFVCGWGSAFVPLQTQAAVLHCAVWGMQAANCIAAIPGAHEQCVKGIYDRWRGLLCNFVKAKQSSIKFGSPKELMDKGILDEVEADGAVFRKRDLDELQVEWEEFHGMKRRGDRSSLALDKTQGSISSRGERGWAVPPPTSKEQWTAIRGKRVGPGTLVHRDGAKAYAKKPDGIYNDGVSHSSKRGHAKIAYAKTCVQNLQSGVQHRSVGGTQSLDGWWKHGKRGVSSTNARYPRAVEARLREAQWRHWIGEKDRWTAAGEVIFWVPGG